MNVENIAGIYDLLKANLEEKSESYNLVIERLEEKYGFEFPLDVLQKDELRLLNEKKNELNNVGKLLYAFGRSEVQL